MKRPVDRWIIAAAALAMAAVAGYLLWPPTRPSPASLSIVTGEMKAPVPPPSSVEERRRLLSDPRVQRYQSQQAFQQQVRRFFADAKTLPPAQRDVQAEALHQQIEPRLTAGELSAAEALLLEIGLIKATVSDETRQALLAKQVADRYRARSEQLEREWAARPKPQFDAYKRREAEIVQRVMAMKEIPAGMDRNEYLRQQLQLAREQSYAQQP